MNKFRSRNRNRNSNIDVMKSKNLCEEKTKKNVSAHTHTHSYSIYDIRINKLIGRYSSSFLYMIYKTKTKRNYEDFKSSKRVFVSPSYERTHAHTHTYDSVIQFSLSDWKSCSLNMIFFSLDGGAARVFNYNLIGKRYFG